MPIRDGSGTGLMRDQKLPLGPVSVSAGRVVDRQHDPFVRNSQDEPTVFFTITHNRLLIEPTEDNRVVVPNVQTEM